MPRKTHDPRANVVRIKKVTSDPGRGRSGRKKRPSMALVPQGQARRPYEWKWNKKKRNALKLFCDGLTLSQIAEETGKPRKTIRHWLSTPEFQGEVLTLMEEHKGSKRIRRMRFTSTMLDTVERNVSQIVDDADKTGVNHGTLLRRLRGWLDQYRSLRSEERADFGDNVQRVEGQLRFQGRIRHENQSVTTMTFAEMAKDIIVPGTLIEANSSQEATAKIVEKVLTEGDFLEKLHAEEASDAEKAMAQAREEHR
jgi:hypothetical protein